MLKLTCMHAVNFFTYILMAIGGIAGGLLYDNISPQAPFLVMLLLVIPSILLTALFVHEPEPEDREA